MKIYLASRSPRRQELLKQIRIQFELIDVKIDETWDGNEIARKHVQRLAIEKAQAGIDAREKNLPVLAADTCIVLDGQILGKAESMDEAKSMLQQLSGRTHSVYSAVTLIHDEVHSALNISHVSFRPLTDSEIEYYCNGQEPLGKAGAYAIQGEASAFIERLDGSYSGVMGLPLYEASQLLNKF